MKRTVHGLFFVFFVLGAFALHVAGAAAQVERAALTDPVPEVAAAAGDALKRIRSG